MTEMAGSEAVGAPRRPRAPVIGAVAGCLLVVAVAALWVRAADPFNPYRPGTHHEVTITNREGCGNTWSVHLDSGSHHYSYRGSAPKDWSPDGVAGTLTILHSWGSAGTDAEFEANGVTVNLKGGSDQAPHFWGEGCTVYG